MQFEGGGSGARVMWTELARYSAGFWPCWAGANTIKMGGQ